MLGLVFASAVAGMLVLGVLGDRLGLRRAMLLTLGFAAAGAAISALGGWGTPTRAYTALAAGRLLLGVGVGGLYPLSAMQSAAAGRAGDGGQKVGWAYFWQTPGAMAPYLVAFALLYLVPSGALRTSVQFRLIVGCGVLPTAVLLYATLRQPSISTTAGGSTPPPRPHPHQRVSLCRALRNPARRWLLCGTAGGWFLYDVAFYGTAVFTPAVLRDIFGEESTLLSVCWQSMLVTGLGLPGALSGVLLLRPMGARWLCLYGLWLMALAFVVLAAVYEVRPTGLAGLKFALFAVLTFTLNTGPGVATFVLPTECFPPTLRGSFHGFSAAAAKVGAVVGAFLFPAVSRSAGMAAVMWLQAGVSVAGALLVAFTLPVVLPYSNEKTSAAVAADGDFGNPSDFDEDADAGSTVPLCDFEENVHEPPGTPMFSAADYAIGSSSSSSSEGDDV
jgi:PHS family inorganic phosphate transporter-like MFS transporter